MSESNIQTRILERAAEIVAKETGQTDIEAIKRTIAVSSRALSQAIMEVSALDAVAEMSTDRVLQPT